MKKILSVLLLVICMTTLTACKSGDYKKADAEMSSEDYEAAFNSFSALGDYKDSAAKAKDCSQFIIEDLAEAAEQNIHRAIDEKNAEMLIQAILSCQNSLHAQAATTDHLYALASEEIAALLKSAEYENFLWLDSLLEAFHESDDLDQTFVQSMDQLQESTAMIRSSAFLNGNWIRCDDALPYGLKLEIIYDNERNVALVTEDLHTADKVIKSSHFDWLKGMAKMQDIVLSSPDSFHCNDLWISCYYNLGVQSQHYEPEIGKLDFLHHRILTQSVKEFSDPWELQKSTSIYINQNDYIPTVPLTEGDFTVTFQEPVNERFEAGDVNLSEWFSYQNKAFYVYDLDNITSTSRGISVGSSWDDVVNAYGHGKMNLFQGSADPYFKYLQQSGAKTPDGEKTVSERFSETAQEYMQYELDNCTLRFYFSDDKVAWIFWTGKQF